MLVEIVDEGSLTGLGANPDPLSFLQSTQQYGQVLRSVLSAAGVSLPPVIASSPEAFVRAARVAAATDVAQILKRHEQAAHKRFAEQAQKLAKAGVPRSEIERRVRSAVEKLPATQARRAAQELTKTGSVSQKTRSALDLAKKLHPGVQEQIKKVTEPVRKLQKKAEQVKKIARDVERVTGTKIGKEVSRQGGKIVKDVARDVTKEVGLDQAKNIAQDTLRKMNVPNVPVVLPTKLTPEGIKDAAYNTGKQYLQGAMQSTLGFSVPLPAKLSVKEIEKTLTGLLPSDAKEAIQIGLDIGTQVAASAISSALTGAVAGSIIPGLGTVIGIGVALGINAIKGALKKAFTEKHAFQQRCKSEDKYKVDLPKLAPVELLPWIAQKRFDMSKAIAEQQKKTHCGLTPYDSGLSQLGHEVFEIVKVTIPVIGLGQVNRLLPLYERAPRQTWYWDSGRIQRGGAIVGGTNRVLLGTVTGTSQEIADTLALLRARKTKLSQLVSQANRADKLQPSELAPLRFELVTELRNAAAQYQITQSAESKKWLSELGGYMQRVAKREGADFDEMKRRYEQDKIRAAQLKAQGKATVVTGIV